MKQSVLNVVIQAAKDHQPAVALSATIAAVLEFLVNRWAADGILLVIVFFMIAINTAAGTYLAVKSGTFSKTVLREKTKLKVVGYMLWLLVTYLVVIAIMIVVNFTETDGEVLVAVPKVLLHYIITATYLFFILVEALSIQKNFKALKVAVPNIAINQLKKLIPKEDVPED